MQAFPMNPDRLEGPVLLLDDAGAAWQLRKKRVDLRAVRRLMKDPASVVVLGESGGTRPRLVVDGERPMLWGMVKDDYKGSGGSRTAGRYLAHEFRTHADRRMLYLEEHC
ncbi:hypothetical protein ACIG0C_05655 [Kitasatospora aureofaciens]|uniref:Uncharacterized protein n=2 Tax=Kitasatospora aureofaciens TaxID=1894 RepID=A0A1E7N309_KITAU|nr:hypothetical protein [Kitasatospora aureofaciens]OEV35055.1 hypothetical protein HS99_0034550 [Kitasatospora aureofaciens]QEU98090.1 hypothetical protein CP971_00885 [Streptomyces viridifaciens]UKZ03945.1 hypothetical protein BOQ63_007710 [Streptomyces viridifaciens]